MTFTEAMATARLGKPVRHDSWPLTRYISFERGDGEADVVGVLVDGAAVRPLRASDFTLTLRSAVDWREVG